MTGPALLLEGITKVYPGTVALENVHFEAIPGEVHGLIGKNGAGKTTLVGILAGLIEPTEGRITIGGKVFSSLSRARAKKEGVAIVPQEPEIILDLSVAENLFLGDLGSAGAIVDWRKLRKNAASILSMYGLDIGVDLQARDLSLSERQLLLIVKACVVEDARVIVLDESSAPLSAKDVRILRRIVEGLKASGKAIVYISHNIDELLGICDRLTVLRDGRVIAERERSGLDHQSLSELVIGEGFSRSSARSDSLPPVDREEFLRVEGLSRWGIFEDISFSLHRGEILGIAGLRGSGRTEILKALAGIEPADEGTLFLKGQPIRPGTPGFALSRGIAYLPEERDAEGLLRFFSIRDNLVLNSIDRFAKWGFLSLEKCSRLASEIFREVQLKAFSIHQDVDELSGGNRQKVVIGRIMANAPDIYLLDEPTRGVDIGAKQAILSIIGGRIRSRSGVIITSPGLDDLVDICDRILVLRNGIVVREYARNQFDEKKIFLDMQGFGIRNRRGGTECQAV